MTTYRDTDIESLIEDLRRINQSSGSEREQLKTELFLKISQKNLDNLYVLCDYYSYNYERAFDGR